MDEEGTYVSSWCVCAVIGANTGKVIDTAVLSSFCHGCSSWRCPKKGDGYYDKWNEEHKKSGNCKRNHFVSAGSVEVEGIKKIFHRSENLYGVRYTNYIGAVSYTHLDVYKRQIIVNTMSMWLLRIKLQII